MIDLETLDSEKPAIQKLRIESILKSIKNCSTGIEQVDRYNRIFKNSQLRMAFMKGFMPCAIGKVGKDVHYHDFKGSELCLLYFMPGSTKYQVQLRYPAPFAPAFQHIPTSFLRSFMPTGR